MEFVVGLQSDIWGDDCFEAFVLSVLQDMAPDVAHTIAAVDANKRFYTAFSERQAAAVRESWFDMARHDPRYFFNRGGWSIFMQSIPGFKPWIIDRIIG